MFKFTKMILTATALLVLVAGEAPAAEPAQKPYIVLDKDLARLRSDFNANVGKVRLLYIVGPTCGICLRGMSDLQESLYSKKGDDPRLVTFVIHVPTLGAQEANVEPASHLIENKFTTHYWEETGIIGKQMQQAIGADKYLWDFWTIYGPKAVWAKDSVPAPDFWQHQLDGLPSDKRLDANTFAAKADEFLATVPTKKSATSGKLGPGAVSE